jgi:hypothetical protein
MQAASASRRVAMRALRLCGVRAPWRSSVRRSLQVAKTDSIRCRTGSSHSSEARARLRRGALESQPLFRAADCRQAGQAGEAVALPPGRLGPACRRMREVRQGWHAGVTSLCRDLGELRQVGRGPACPPLRGLDVYGLCRHFGEGSRGLKGCSGVPASARFPLQQPHRVTAFSGL